MFFYSICLNQICKYIATDDGFMKQKHIGHGTVNKWPMSVVKMIGYCNLCMLLHSMKGVKTTLSLKLQFHADGCLLGCTQCNILAVDQSSGRTYCLHSQSWRWRLYVSLKQRQTAKTVHIVTSQKTTTFTGTLLQCSLTKSSA